MWNSLREGIKKKSPAREKRRPAVMRERVEVHSPEVKKSGPLRKATEESILNRAVPVWGRDTDSEMTSNGRDPMRRYTAGGGGIDRFVDILIGSDSSGA